LVQDRPAAVRISTTKDEIHIRKLLRDPSPKHAVLNRFDRRGGTYSPCVLRRNRHLGAANVGWYCADQSIEICRFDDVWVEQQELADAKVGQLLQHEGAGSTQADDPNAERTELGLPNRSKDASLAIERAVASHAVYRASPH
jgi:hypothetical protein